MAIIIISRFTTSVKRKLFVKYEHASDCDSNETRRSFWLIERDRNKRAEKRTWRLALINCARNECSNMSADNWTDIFLLVYSFVTTVINIFLPIAADYHDVYSRVNFIVQRTPVVIFSISLCAVPRVIIETLMKKGASKVNIRTYIVHSRFVL